MEEKDLIAKLKEGNRRAFNHLVDSYRDPVANTCYGFVGDRDEAQDLAQEVFVEVFFSIGKFRSDAKLSTWIYRIAVNKSLDLLRKQKRRQNLARIENVLSFGRKEDKVSVSSDENPGEEMEKREQKKLIRQAILNLPENQRIVFNLRRQGIMGNKEIAELMDISVKSVESLLHRAKTAIRQELETQYKEKNNSARRK